MLELPKNNLISRVLLQINNTVYMFGFDPITFMKRYVQRTEKGFMNLSNYEFGMSLS